MTTIEILSNCSLSPKEAEVSNAIAIVASIFMTSFDNKKALCVTGQQIGSFLLVGPMSNRLNGLAPSLC